MPFGGYLVAFGCVGVAIMCAFTMSAWDLGLLWTEQHYRNMATALCQVCFGLGNVLWALLYDHVFSLEGALVAMGLFGVVAYTLLAWALFTVENYHRMGEAAPLMAALPPQHGAPQVAPVPEWWAVLRMCLRSTDFRLICVCMLAMLGCAVNVMNNAVSMLAAVDAAHGGPCRDTNIIVASGACQTVSRVLIFFSSLQAWFNPFLAWLLTSSALTALYISASAVGIGCSAVWSYTLVASFLYGATWILFYPALGRFIATLQDDPRIGAEVVGFASMLGPALGPLLMTLVSGIVYDHYGSRGDGGDVVCYGQDCFRVSFVVGSALLAVSTACAAVLHWRNRGQ